MLPDIPGKMVTDRTQLFNLQETVAKLLDFNGNPKRFPGAQPVSFASCHISELLSENYLVSEKADGIRCLLYTRAKGDQVESFLIDRKNNFYYNHFGLPLPGLKHAHRNTILDGELVFEKVKGETELWFLFFDALVVDNKNLTTKSYNSRLGYLRERVIQPYLESCKRKPGYASKFPFKMRQKRVQFSYELGAVFKQMKKYGHKTDGLLFTSAVAPLKWKPSDENTVDFKISVHEDDGLKYHINILVDRDDYKDFGEITLDDDLKAEWDSNPPNGRIIECRYDPEWPNTWRFSRYRDDKLDANHISTFEKIMESIRDNVTEEEVNLFAYGQLIDSVVDIYKQWKTRDPGIRRSESVEEIINK